MRATSKRARHARGITMIIALLFVGVLIVVADFLIANATYAVVNERVADQRSHVFAAAESGVDTGKATVAANVASITTQSAGSSVPCTGASFTSAGVSYAFTCAIIVNPSATSITVNDPDVPAGGGPMQQTLPPYTALVEGVGQPPQLGGTTVGRERVAVVKIVSLPPTQNPPDGFANALGDIIAPASNVVIAGDPLDLGALCGVPPVPCDAHLHADGRIAQVAPTGLPCVTMQGNTFAGGADLQGGCDGKTHANVSPGFNLLAGSTLAAIVQQAKSQAKNGTIIDTATLATQINSSNGPSGFSLVQPTYVTGDLTLSSGILTINTPGTVYFDGNLCLSGLASIVNAKGATLVVSGQFHSSAAPGYSIVKGMDGEPAGPALRSSGKMVVLGGDHSSSCPGDTEPYSVVSQTAGNDVGLLYAANGSVEVNGSSSALGELWAANDVRFQCKTACTFSRDRNTDFLYKPPPVVTLSYQEYTYSK